MFDPIRPTPTNPIFSAIVQFLSFDFFAPYQSWPAAEKLKRRISGFQLFSVSAFFFLVPAPKRLGHGFDFTPAFEADVKEQKAVPENGRENHEGPEHDK